MEIGRMIRIWLIVFAVAITVMAVFAVIGTEAEAEEEPTELQPLYVISDGLNARLRPSKKSMIMTQFEFLDILQPTGRWSSDHGWIEILDPEYGELWININYVSDRLDIFEVYSLNDHPIKVRSKPVTGKVKKNLKKEEHTWITQSVLGYGKCEWGWVDLGYFIEEAKDECLSGLYIRH